MTDLEGGRSWLTQASIVFAANPRVTTNAFARHAVVRGMGGPGWLGLATATDDAGLIEREEQVRERWERSYNPSRRRQNKSARETCIDLARIDITRWLRAERADFSEHGTENSHMSSSPDSMPRARQGKASGSSEVIDSKDPHRTLELQDPAEQALQLANAIAIPTWATVREFVDHVGGSPKQIKHQLANHVWCDLFVALARAIEEGQYSISRLPDAVKAYVKSLVLGSPMRGTQSKITAKIVDVLVDKAWSALKAYAETHMPVVRLVTGEETLRSLRILAYMSCPDPDRHHDVREHALRPLEKHVQDMLSDETRQRLRESFVDWLDTDAFGQTA